MKTKPKRKVKAVVVPEWKKNLERVWKVQAFRTFVYSFSTIFMFMVPWYLMSEEKQINFSELKEYQPPTTGVDPLRYKEEREGGLRVYQKGKELYWANDPSSKRMPIQPKVHY
jgi:hypothetical protein